MKQNDTFFLMRDSVSAECLHHQANIQQHNLSPIHGYAQILLNRCYKVLDAHRLMQLGSGKIWHRQRRLTTTPSSECSFSWDVWYICWLSLISKGFNSFCKWIPPASAFPIDPHSPVSRSSCSSLFLLRFLLLLSSSFFGISPPTAAPLSKFRYISFIFSATTRGNACGIAARQKPRNK